VGGAGRADVAIWTVRMEPGAAWTLPAARRRGHEAHAVLLQGRAAQVGGQPVQGPVAMDAARGCRRPLVAGDTVCEFLLLQGRPIAEPVAQYGPFVMNTQQEISRPCRTTAARSSAAGSSATARRCTARARSGSRSTRTAARN
jgi:redox-sensitive bicupin YhaK (pirin superfamily)